MKVWLRRLLILLFVLFWLALLLTPTLAVMLARNGQLRIGLGEERYWRFFLVQQAEAEGVGMERSRPVDPPAGAADTIHCSQQTVDYWMWTGEGQSVEYCQCLDGESGQSVDIVPPACQSPAIE